MVMSALKNVVWFMVFSWLMWLSIPNQQAHIIPNHAWAYICHEINVLCIYTWLAWSWLCVISTKHVWSMHVHIMWCISTLSVYTTHPMWYDVRISRCVMCTTMHTCLDYTHIPTYTYVWGCIHTHTHEPITHPNHLSTHYVHDMYALC